MKKICVSTYCEWTSYGSVLQALGLKKALEEIDCNSFIVKDCPESFYKKIRSFKFTKNPKELVKNILDLFYLKSKRKILNKGNAFIESNLNIKYFNSYKDLKENFPKADVYLAGSDQIWHPALCKSAFFLDFAPKNSKKISYAASMGVTDIPPQNKEKFSALLKNINSFSVREKEMVPVIKSITKKEPFINIDPTFLVSADEWRKYKVSCKIKKPYILIYALYWDKSLNSQLKTLHKKTKLPIVSIQSSFREIYSNKVLLDVGPAEFLWLVDNAQAVITSSFHGTAFSVIFNKKFSTVVNPNAKSRINSLLNILDIKTPLPVNVLNEFNVDYACVNKKIKREKEKSLDYLRSEIFGN